MNPEPSENVARVTRRQVAMLAAVLVLGCALRLYGLADKSLWYDEACTMAYVYQTETIRGAFDTTFTYDAPLFLAAIKAWDALVQATVHPARLSEQGDAALRLFPFLCGMFAMPLLFVVARLMLRDNIAAIAAAFLYAISPYQIRYAQELRAYTLLTLLGLAAFYFLVKAMRDNHARHWAGLALAEVLVFYTHFFGAWVIAAINLYVVIVFVAGRDRRDRRIAPWVVSHVAAALVALPAMLMLLRVAACIDQIKHHFYQLHSGKIALIAFKAFFAGFSPNTPVYWALFLLAGGLFCLGLVALRRHWQTALLLALLVAVPLVGNVALTYARGYSLYELRLFILSGVAAYIVVAAGLMLLPGVWLRAGTAAAFALLTAPLLADYYSGPLHPVEAHRVGIWDKVDFRSAAMYVRDNFRDRDVIGHPGHFTAVPFRYYLDLPNYMLGHTRFAQQFMIDNMGSREVIRRHDMLAKPIQDVAAQASRIWFLETYGTTFDWPPSVMTLRIWLETHALREDYRVFDGVTVTCYDTDLARRASVLRDQLADRGDAPLVRYRFSPDSPDIQVAAARDQYDTLPCDTFEARFQLSDSMTDPAGCSMVGENPRSGKPLWASFPSNSRDTFHYSFTVTNAGAFPRNLECAVYESAGAVEPLAWLRDDPLDSPWQVFPQYDPATAGSFNRPAMIAVLEGADAPPTTMQGWALLPPGRYRPYVRLLEEPAGHALSRAAGTFTLRDGGAVLGKLDGEAIGPEAGWHWRPLDEFESPGGLIDLSVTVENEKHFPQSYFELDKIIFVPAEEARGETPFLKQQFDAPLGPGESKTFTLDGTLGSQPRKRVDIDVFDPAARMYRNLTFHVEATQ